MFFNEEDFTVIGGTMGGYYNPSTDDVTIFKIAILIIFVLKMVLI